MPVLVPFGAAAPKSRLASVFDADERREFAELLLGDVVDAVRTAGLDPLVVTTEPLERAVEATVEVDDRALSPVVNDAIQRIVGSERADDATDDDGLVVLAADLGLLTAAAVDRLVGTEGDVVLAPGRGVGTNALVVRTPAFRVDYHGASFLDHRAIAEEVGVEPSVVDSFRLATDVDEPDDLVEVFVHGEGEASEWLRERFELDVEETGRVGLQRRG